MVTVVVGVQTDQRRFTIHKQQALNASPFFHACLGGKFNEGPTGVLDLPDKDPETFAFVMDFIYTGTFRKDGDVSSIDDLRVEVQRCDPEYASAYDEWCKDLDDSTTPRPKTPKIVREMELKMA